MAFAISGKVIAPAEPPEPSPRKTPFHVPAGGIQTSKLMSDWLVGVAGAETRQKGGRLAKVWPLAEVWLPAGIVSPAIIVTSVRLREAKFEHVSAEADPLRATSSANARIDN